jgi:hypothetical protein
LQLLATAGSASAPAFSSTDDPNTGIHFPGADNIAIAAGGVDAAKIDVSYVNVKVGASTTYAPVVVLIHESSADDSTSPLDPYTVPASALNATGETIHYVAEGVCADVDVGSPLTITIAFGATTIISRTENIGATNWRAEAWIVRTGAATQKVSGEIRANPTLYSTQGMNDTTAAETLSGSVTLQMTFTAGGDAAATCALKQSQIYWQGFKS